MLASTIQFKRGTAKRWEELNLVLLAGEPGFEIDTGKLKIGDGQTPWKDLSYLGGGSVFNASTHYDFPSVGKTDVIYKAQAEKMLYQWNTEKLYYESLGSSSEGGVIDINLIHGGNAYGNT